MYYTGFVTNFGIQFSIFSIILFVYSWKLESYLVAIAFFDRSGAFLACRKLQDKKR